MIPKTSKSSIRHKGSPVSPVATAPAHSLVKYQTFKLPGSMSFSDVHFPVLIKPAMRRVVWKEIVEDHGKRMEMLHDFDTNRNGTKDKQKSVFMDVQADYTRDTIFAFLLPVLEKTLDAAKLWNAFEDPMCLFNGVDHIAQLLWNNNPRYPKRKEDNLYIFDMPWVQEHLKTNPRPLLPRSWLWTKDYAATVIQKNYRRYLTLAKPDVIEMRGFWNKIKKEITLSEVMNTNPLLMKFFAAQEGVRFASMTHTDKDELKKLLEQLNMDQLEVKN